MDAQRPYVMVNKPEKYADRVERKAANIKAPKLSWHEVYEGKQKRRATAAARAVMEMNAYWAKHPLTLQRQTLIELSTSHVPHASSTMAVLSVAVGGTVAGLISSHTSVYTCA